MTPSQQKRALTVAAGASFIIAALFFLVGIWLNVLLDGLDTNTCTAIGLSAFFFLIVGVIAFMGASEIEDDES